MKWLLPAAGALALALAAPGDDKKSAGAIKLTLVAKTDKYKFDGGGKLPAEFKKELEQIAKEQKDGKLGRAIKPQAVDLVLVLTNTSKEDVTIYVGGDANVFTLELTGGDGSVALGSELPFTADFKLPRPVALAPGKTYEIPVKQLSDGLRGAARNVYWTGPGEYKLTARYALADKEGNKGEELKSEPVKITVTEK